MDINSTPILSFIISKKESENYNKIGISKWSFDRTKLLFEFGTIFNKTIEIPIKKGQKIKEILQAIQQTLIDQLPLTDDITELFESSIMKDIESQLDDNLDRIYKSYFDEQREINPFVRDAVQILSINNQKITKEDINFIFRTIKKQAPDDDLAMKLIFYAGKSTFTNLVIGVVVDSKEAGAGKSYLIKLYLSYEDPKYVRIYTYISEKALYHGEGIKILTEEDGKIVEAQPIIDHRREELTDLEDELVAEKSKSVRDIGELKKNPEKIRSLVKRCNVLKNEISDLENKTQKLIIFTYKLIVVLDTPEDNLFNLLMGVLSQDTDRDPIYSFTDKDSKGSQRARNIRTQGTPGFLYSQVVDNTKDRRFKELNRRFTHVNPNTSRLKIQHANELIWLNFGSTDEEKDEDIVSRADKQKVKELMALMNAKFIVQSSQFSHKESGCELPFKRTLSSLASNRSPWQMTVQERATKFLTAIVYSHMDFRPKLINKRTNQSYIFTLFEDIQLLYYLMQHGALGVRPYLMDWYNKVLLPEYKKLDGKKYSKITEKGNHIEEDECGLYVSDLIEATLTYTGEKLSSRQILDNYVEPLYNQGIIDKIRSNIDKRAYLLKPVDETEISSSFIKAVDKIKNQNNELGIEQIKIRIKDPSAFPDKNLLKHELRRFVKGEKEGGEREQGDQKTMGEIIRQENGTFFKNIFDVFSIVDEDGNEITVDELIDRYYNKPEKYFQLDTSKDNTSDIISKTFVTTTDDKSDQNDPLGLGKDQNEEKITKKGENTEITSENYFEKKVGDSFRFISPSGFSPTNFKRESQTGVIGIGASSDETDPNLLNYAAFDFEYDIKPDDDGRQHIIWFSLVDNSGYTYTKSVQDFSSEDEPEKELVKAAITRIKKYDLTFGWYSTGVKDRKHNRGKDSDLKILNDAIWHYDLERIISFDDDYPYLPRIKDQMHIDLCLLYGNPIVQDNIYEDRYDENSLDVVAKGLLDEGKYEGLDGFEALKLSKEEQQKYVTQDAKLTLKLAEFEDFNVLKIFLDMSDKVGLPLDTICHTTPSIWWESGIAKEGGLNVLPPKLEKRDFTGGMVMEVPKPIFYLSKNHNGNCGYVIDVASQYPTGIINFNLSPETICCDCCKDNPEAKIPQKIMYEINKKLPGKDKRSIHYWVCKKRRGFIAELIKKYRDERLEDKRAGRKHKQKSLKILINSLYGTFGQSKFAHSDYRLAEITTAFGRHVWSQMKSLAESEKYNFKVIYGDTDSIFLINATYDKLIQLLEDWHAQYEDIEVEIEDTKTFESLLLPEKKHYILIPANKENPILTKGMEGKKSDRPMWINKIQHQLSSNLSNPEKIKEFIQQEYQRMESGQVDLSEMIMKKKLGQDPAAYKYNCDMKVIGLAQNKIAGDSIKFYKGEKGKAVTDPTQISRKEYLDMLKDTFKKQLTPIGIDFDRDIKNNGLSLLIKTSETKSDAKEQGNL